MHRNKESDSPSKLFIAYALSDARISLIPAPHERNWISALPYQFARRCLPLIIANQAEWFILNSDSFEAIWNGGSDTADLTIAYDDLSAKPWACSHFGYGILTFKIPLLFRTPEGYDLHVRGPANVFKDGIHPLEGIVESDWSVATFTMNWAATRIGKPIRFAANEPICMVKPTLRRELVILATLRGSFTRTAGCYGGQGLLVGVWRP